MFPTDAADLTPGLLTAALSEMQPGVRVDDLEILETAHCDSGSASTAGRARLALHYAEGRDEGLPRQMVLKTILVRPGAPLAMYENEVRFYREIRPELEIEAPEVHASVFDAASRSFGVVMEDVSLRPARFPNAMESMTLDEAADLLANLARLHARFWQSPRFEKDLGWLWTPLSGGFHDTITGMGQGLLRHNLERSEAKREMLDRLGRSLEMLWADLWAAQEILASEPTTLLHGDCHLGNTYLLPGGRAGLLDWQLMNRGRWSHDVTYILVTGLDVELRRRHERELLTGYLEGLRAAGVAEPPGEEEAWLLHRQTAVWGFVIGWLICPVENYGPEILRANLERLVAALEDLDTFSALGRGATR